MATHIPLRRTMLLGRKCSAGGCDRYATRRVLNTAPLQFFLHHSSDQTYRPTYVYACAEHADTSQGAHDE